MPRRPTLILFGKVPRLGAVKTRLAAAIGPGAARRTYRTLTDRAIRALAGDRRWHTVLAATPDRVAWRSWPRRLVRTSQGRGDIGTRMARCLRRWAKPAAILIGTDVPGADAGHLARAFRGLAAADFVFGPAEDGGFWLVGWRRRGGWPPGALKGVRWSSHLTLEQTVASLPRLRRIALADRLADVDTGEDYRRWRSTRTAAGYRPFRCPFR